MIKFFCLHCGAKVSAEHDTASHSANCPSCGGGLVVPDSADPAPADLTELMDSPPQLKKVSKKALPEWKAASIACGIVSVLAIGGWAFITNSHKQHATAVSPPVRSTGKPDDKPGRTHENLPLTTELPESVQPEADSRTKEDAGSTSNHPSSSLQQPKEELVIYGGKMLNKPAYDYYMKGYSARDPEVMKAAIKLTLNRAEGEGERTAFLLIYQGADDKLNDRPASWRLKE